MATSPWQRIPQRAPFPRISSIFASRSAVVNGFGSSRTLASGCAALHHHARRIARHVQHGQIRTRLLETLGQLGTAQLRHDDVGQQQRNALVARLDAIDERLLRASALRCTRKPWRSSASFAKRRTRVLVLDEKDRFAAHRSPDRSSRGV